MLLNIFDYNFLSILTYKCNVQFFFKYILDSQYELWALFCAYKISKVTYKEYVKVYLNK